MFLDAFKDKEFYRKLIIIVIPIIIQQLISSSLNLVDNVMIGNLGEVKIASVGLANQFYFIFTILTFGISSGSSVFTAQFWGKRDVKNIRRVVGLNLFICSMIGLIFFLVAMGFPKLIIGLFTNDLEVINIGGKYLRITAIGYLFNSISLAYGYSSRAVGQAKLPMYVSAVAVVINTILNYILIFGKLGFPQLGVEGAALATTAARLIEVFLIVFIIYSSDNILAAKLSELKDFSSEFLLKIIKTSIPVVMNDLFWVLGVTACSAAYARINTEAFASFQIANLMQNIFFIIAIGMGSASAVMIGNEIGADNEHKLMDYVKKFLVLGVQIGIILGIIMYIVAPKVLLLYHVTDKVSSDAVIIIRILSSVLWIKTINMIVIVGVLRGGGDTKYAMYTEVGTIWLVGVPLTFFGVLVLNLPVYFVVIMTLSEEVVKAVIGLKRIFSKKWINNLTV